MTERGAVTLNLLELHSVQSLVYERTDKRGRSSRCDATRFSKSLHWRPISRKEATAGTLMRLERGSIVLVLALFCYAQLVLVLVLVREGELRACPSRSSLGLARVRQALVCKRYRDFPLSHLMDRKKPSSLEATSPSCLSSSCLCLPSHLHFPFRSALLSSSHPPILCLFAPTPRHTYASCLSKNPVPFILILRSSCSSHFWSSGTV